MSRGWGWTMGEDGEPAEVPPRRDWMRAVEEKGWELLAEVPGGGYYLDLREKSATVILRRPEGRPRRFTAAMYFGSQGRDEAIAWARRKARGCGRLGKGPGLPQERSGSRGR